MIDFNRLFSIKFIFNPGPGTMSKNFATFFLIVFAIFLILAVVAYIFSKKQAKLKNLPLMQLWQKIFNLSIYLSVTGFILLFFRQQSVYFLSLPFLWYLYFIGGLVWLILVLRWAKVRMKKIQQEIQEREERKKYLP